MKTVIIKLHSRANHHTEPAPLHRYEAPMPPRTGDSVRCGDRLYLVEHVAWILDRGEVDVLVTPDPATRLAESAPPEGPDVAR